MFKFKVFKHIAFNYFLDLWMDIFGVSYLAYLDWLSSKLTSIIMVGVDSENMKMFNESVVYVIWVPSLLSIEYIDDWTVYQVGQFAIFASDQMYFDFIIRSDYKSLMYDITNTNFGGDNEYRIGNQVKHILDYISGLDFENFIDLGSGDSELSVSLSSILKHKYIPLDLKLGHSVNYMISILSNSSNDLILMRNSLHHFESVEFLSNLNSKYVIIIDYFGYATSFASIYHFIYKEPFICWDINNIKYALRKYNFMRMLDSEINTSGPTGYLFTAIDSDDHSESFYSNDLLPNFYDMQVINDDMSIGEFNIDDLVIKNGMLRGFVDYFFDFRLPFKLSNFSDKISYINKVKEFANTSNEVKPDDIKMWIGVFENISFSVCDPFSGWCSRLLAFSILRWFDSNSTFYWFDLDSMKHDATIALISHLKFSGCRVNFIYIDDSITIPDNVFIVTSPFYLNFEQMYGNKSTTFKDANDWANYVVGFINQKCKKLYPSIIQMNNYKGNSLSDKLFSRLPDGSYFTLVNDLGYFRFKIGFKSIMYNQVDIPKFTFGISSKVNMNLIIKSSNNFVYKCELLNSKIEIKNNLINNNCSFNICGHFGYQNNYISGALIHSEQLKLFNLIMDLSSLGYTYIIYVGSGNGFSILTDYAIEYLTSTKGIIFLLLDKYTVIPKRLLHTNIIIPNAFLTNDNFKEMLSLVKVNNTDKLLLLSDIKSFKDVSEYEYNLRRADEFMQEIQLYNRIISYFMKVNVVIDTCLKINYSSVPYMIPDVGLFMPIGVTGEFRILVENKIIDCNLEMSSEMFDMLISGMLIQQFDSDDKICAYCKFFDSLDI